MLARLTDGEVSVVSAAADTCAPLAAHGARPDSLPARDYGVYQGEPAASEELAFRALAHLTTRDVALVLERTRDRMTKYLRRRGRLDEGDAEEEEDASERAGLTRLAASAVSGTTPPAGPEWRRRALSLAPRAMVFERPLCVALDGFTLSPVGDHEARHLRRGQEEATTKDARPSSSTSSVPRSRRSG